jgi:hypothetical protein
MPASTLLAVKDDRILRRILCHEYGHCFWYIERLVDREHTIHDRACNRLSLAEKIAYQQAKDAHQHADPFKWFGQADAEEFMLTEDSSLDEASNCFAKEWRDTGLPLRLVNMCMDVEGESSIFRQRFSTARARRLDAAVVLRAGMDRAAIVSPLTN